MRLTEAIEAIYLNREIEVKVQKKPHLNEVEHTQGRNENDQTNYSTGGTKNVKKFRNYDRTRISELFQINESPKIIRCNENKGSNRRNGIYEKNR